MSLLSTAGITNISVESYERYVLSLRPVAYWPMNESSGTIVNDWSGNLFNGTILPRKGSSDYDGLNYSNQPIRRGSTGCIEFGVNGNQGSSIDISNQYIPIMQMMGEHFSSTICGWFSVGDIPRSDGGLMGTGTYADKRYMIDVNASQFLAPSSKNRVIIPVSGIGEIMFFAWKRDITNRVVTVYRNGINYSAGMAYTENNQIATYPLEIPFVGRYQGAGASSSFNGKLSDFAMFDRALSEEEIEKMYLLGKFE